MSLARVVITAVIVEGRSKSEVARDYGVSRVWVQKLVHRYQREGPAAFEPRSRRPHSNPRAVSLDLEDQVIRLRKELSKKGLDAGAETIAAHLQIAGVDPVPAVSTIWRILSRRGFVVRNRRNGPAHHGRRSAPSSPTSAGRPTSPIGGSLMAPRWRSSTSSMTTPGFASPAWPAGSPPAPRCGQLRRRLRPVGHPGQRAHR